MMSDPTVNKSAQTRFNNDRTVAAQRSMVGNPAAQASLRKQSHTIKGYKGSPPVGNTPLIQPQAPVSLPTGGPQLPPEQTEAFDPVVFRENMVNQIVGAARTQEFIESPQVKDALTSVTVRNFFNATNPNATPDNRSILQKVMSRLRLGDDDGV